MFKELLCTVALIGFAAAAVPSYIQVCGARNKNLDQCILNSVSALNPKLKTGIPELSVPAIEPLLIDFIKLVDMPNFHATAWNVKVSGLANFRVDHLHCDLQKQQLDLDVHFDQTKLEAMYNMTAKILLPLAGTGPIQIITKDIDAKVRLNWKVMDRAGKKYMFFPSMTTKMAIADYTAKFQTDGVDKTLEDAINAAFTDSHKELLESTRPNLEKAISRKCLELANKICKHFTYDELFPDRE